MNIVFSCIPTRDTILCDIIKKEPSSVRGNQKRSGRIESSLSCFWLDSFLSLYSLYYYLSQSLRQVGKALILLEFDRILNCYDLRRAAESFSCL